MRTKPRETTMLTASKQRLTHWACTCAMTVGLAACAHATAPAVSGSVSSPILNPPPPFSEAALPHYLVRRAVAPITIDGRLGEFDWAAAPQINGFTHIRSGQVLQATRARMVWNDEALYIAFACRDGEMWALFTEEDDPMWSEEVVEAFIDPDGDGRDYLEVEVNPLNAIVDLRLTSITPEWVSDKDWDIAGLQTAVEIHGTVNDSTDVDAGWTVEMAIPWAAFAPQIRGGGQPQIGDRWRLNLYRIERGAGAGAAADLRLFAERRRSLRAELAALGDQDPATQARLQAQLEELQAEAEPLSTRYEELTEYTAWSPTFAPGFHNPARFGIIEFAP